MLKEVASVPDFVDLEKQIVDYWAKINAPQKLKELRANAPEKVYYDGPITANNMPHYGHVVAWTLKDIIPRYWSMNGFFVSRNMGWDCQGIPVEYEVEKQLGFKNKKDVEIYGVEKFNQLCRESVLKYKNAMYDYEAKVGRWFDEGDMYFTMDSSFIESIWWSLKELYTKGLLYEGYKVVAYSTRAGTTLSTHEVSEGGYKDVEDPFITVKFELVKEPGTFVLAWTTTPWTIPGNLLLAVGKNIEYCKVALEGFKYILAKERLAEVFKGKDYKLEGNLSSKDLEGLEYRPIFDYYREKTQEGCFKIVIASHANTEEGTGVVHLAPYGAEDFEVFQDLGIKMFDYLDDTATFTSEIPQYQGLFYKDANSKIINDLEAKNALFATGKIVHRMPICWRTGTPLIFKPIKSWYVAVTKIKQRMMEENQKVHWVPEHLKDGYSGGWIENAKDWALSRSRYWGTPLPVWINDKTGQKVFIGSFAELKQLSGMELSDPHKPFVDQITWEDKVNGGTFKRVADVIDVWYDSGSVPFAKLHYPFKNKELFAKKFPAEYIAEGLDQVHLWFYVMHVLGVALFDRIPYKNVVTNGMMLSKVGEKLSKSKKNYPPLDDVLDKFGADILRFFILQSPLVKGESARFYDEALGDVKKEFFLTLWNCLKYFNIYANLCSYQPKDLQEPSNLENNLDIWIVSRLKETILEVRENLDKYYIMEATRALKPLVIDLSTWYIRRSRDRLKNGDVNALAVLHYVLSNVSLLLAPFTPFIAEEMYEVLGLREARGLDSVHFDLYPVAKELMPQEKRNLDKMKITRSVVSLALSIRTVKGIKVRQPLSAIYLAGVKLDSLYKDLVIDEANIKNVEDGFEESKLLTDLNFAFMEDKGIKVYLDTSITDELRIEGTARELVRAIQDLRKEKGLTVNQKVSITYPNTPENLLAVEKMGEEIKQKVGATHLLAGDNLDLV
ncbi:isoleucine--tRNA ligase [candidate division WWE3 bacterium CG08_land_8_20_14_0_20_41_10]|uniref:Isoleucine--tRNA ligase n=1 Tax=candidate division WWE3 bacterium CG08_land_8_20_14_0_20_41_10 TaxID=1975085 RepID=A0A2H0XBQ8_UNCKA|nr:MAG: isoleucine--tRNA ligase [candidate division WWE3 bacterium CG08_land_8_20_14_0_20_41_10]